MSHSSKTNELCFIRNEGIHGVTCLAILSVSSLNWITPGEALIALKRGCTDWALKNSEGRQAWLDSSEDFNVGDLMSYLADSDLCACLLARGLTKVDVLYQLGEAEDVSYDKVLIDGDELKVSVAGDCEGLQQAPDRHGRPKFSRTQPIDQRISGNRCRERY